MKSQSINYRALTACFGTILLAGIVPSIAAAATPTVTHYRFSDLFAELGFGSSSDSIATGVHLEADQGQGATPGSVFIEADQDNFLTGSSSCYFGVAPLTTSQFQITKSLQSASLDVTGVVLYDCYTGEPGPTADASVTWTGSGGTPNGFNSTNTFRSGVFIERDRSSGWSRNATASGTVVIDGTNFLIGTPSADFTYADLGKYRLSVVDILKKPF
jgi:hypothetical protein